MQVEEEDTEEMDLGDLNLDKLEKAIQAVESVSLYGLVRPLFGPYNCTELCTWPIYMTIWMMICTDPNDCIESLYC